MERTTKSSRFEGDEILVSAIIALLCCFLIMMLPPYDRMIYSSTEKTNERAYGLAGYPAGDGIPVAHSVADIKTGVTAFTIEVDADKIEALNVYKGIGNYKLSTSWIDRLTSKWLNKTTMGGYYIVTLDSDEKITVFLDDQAFKIPTSGKVRLPIGNYEEFSYDLKVRIQASIKMRKLSQVLNVLVDMASDWRCHSEDAKRILMIRWSAGILTFFGTWVIMYFRLKNSTKKNKEKTKDSKSQK